MLVVCIKNVNLALNWGVSTFQQLEQDARNIVAPRGSRTVESPSPVCTLYYQPCERVLMSPVRNANPFFHFFESLWMLAGRNDLSFPQKFNGRFHEYSDDGQTLWGAYGHRWRVFFGSDQLSDIVELLRKEPQTRRAVLGMWSAGVDLKRGAEGGRDVPCNTHIYFKIRSGALQMMVCNRSNDMLWGAYGANAVHMSMLQEYVAGRVGVPVGQMRQVSDSLHVYLDGAGGELWTKLKEARSTLGEDPYKTLRSYPMGADNPYWDTDLTKFMSLADQAAKMQSDYFNTPFFSRVVTPMWRAWESRDSLELDRCAAVDWKRAGQAWLERRG